MIPNPDAFEPTGNPLTDTALKLNLLSQNKEITWTRHPEDPRSSNDRYAQRESDGVGQWFTYQPEDADWTFLLYELRQPPGPTVVRHLMDRVKHPHLQVLDGERHVAVDFPPRTVIDHLFRTVYRSYGVNDEAMRFVSEFSGSDPMSPET